MSTITTIQGTDKIGDSRTVLNTNLSNLNTDKLEAADIDTQAKINAIRTNLIDLNVTAGSSGARYAITKQFTEVKTVTASDFYLSLPAASSVNVGDQYTILNQSTSDSPCAALADGSDTIGDNTYAHETIYKGESLTFTALSSTHWGVDHHISLVEAFTALGTTYATGFQPTDPTRTTFIASTVTASDYVFSLTPGEFPRPGRVQLIHNIDASDALTVMPELDEDIGFGTGIGFTISAGEWAYVYVGWNNNYYVLERSELALTTAERSKLSGIETGSTADQTDAEIKTAYENNADTNAVTDAEKTVIGNTSGTNTGDEVASSATVAGVVELATLVEVDAGTDTVRAVTPAGLATIQTDVDANTAKVTYPSGDSTKLSGIEALADVTDATNVTAAGALMDSEVTNLAAVKAFATTDYATAAQGTTADSASQATGVENNADVTDTANVTSAGALMDSELASIASVKAMDQGVAVADAPTFDGVFMSEKAAADADVAGDGQFWTKNTVANRPMFTDDAGTDYELLRLDGGIAASDETTALTASTSVAKASFHAQRAGLIEEVLVGLTAAPTGSIFTGDVHLNGTTIFSTKPTIDATEKTSVTAATAAVLTTSPTVVAKGDLIELFADGVGSTITGAGLKFYFNYIK